ncbi:hypothetical protein mEp044_71 [Escherichia phage mEp044]
MTCRRFCQPAITGPILPASDGGNSKTRNTG